MSLNAYMTTGAGRLEPVYEFPEDMENRCTRCGFPQESTIQVGAMWYCPGCHEECSDILKGGKK